MGGSERRPPANITGKPEVRVNKEREKWMVTKKREFRKGIL